jgi:tyrosine-protein phosphatase SIW14
MFPPMLLRIILPLFLAFTVAFAAEDPTEFQAYNPDKGPQLLAGVPRSAQLTPEIYRGGQPTPEGLKSISARGIKTIISLRDRDEVVSENQPIEEAYAKANGITFRRFPIPGVPTLREVQQVFALIEAAEKPVLVHCLNGSERTTTIMGIYRLRHDGWTIDRVLAEADSFGIGFRTQAYRNFLKAYAATLPARPTGVPMAPAPKAAAPAASSPAPAAKSGS